MRVARRLVVVALVTAVGLGAAGIARAQVDDSDFTNGQDGNNSETTSQRGEDASGDAVGGQVAGVVAQGRTSVDARNTSRNSSIESGEAFGENTSRSVTGLNAAVPDPGVSVTNAQDGNNRTSVSQTADASSGDGISGQVIGAVTGPSGSVSIVARNLSEDDDIETGDALFFNVNESFVGLNATGTALLMGSDAIAANTQDGNNSLAVDQTASSSTGNGIAGQVIGAVSNGATSIDADNRSVNNDVDTVFTESDNTTLAFVGLDANPVSTGNGFATATNVQDGNNRATIHQFAPGTANSASAVVGLNAEPTSDNADAIAANEQDGNNAFALDQTAPVSTASVDSVAGQVVGAVTDVGGTASLVAANVSDSNSVHNIGVAGQIMGVVSAGAASVDASNNSTNNDVDGGVTAGSNDATAFVGLDAEATTGKQGNVPATATNVQDGNNRAGGFQSSSVTGGVPIAGQVIGDVTGAGGSSSIVAANTSEDNTVETGDAEAPNSMLAFVGLEAEAYGGEAAVGAEASNTQDGNNSFRLSDLSSAASGDAIAGEILGVVSAGATSLDARNRSGGNTAESADAFSSNDSRSFVGLHGEADDNTGSNIQDGNNRRTSSHSAEATTGDAIAGQVGGVVTAAGGASSVALDNTSEGIDAETGEAEFFNVDDLFVGLNFGEQPLSEAG